MERGLLLAVKELYKCIKMYEINALLNCLMSLHIISQKEIRKL